MTNHKDKMLHIDRGIRLKQLAKENGLTREDLSSLIGYSTTHISRIYNGASELKDDIAQILSDEFHIRKEFILCEDDFKTDDEMYACIKENDIKNLQYALDYLKSLGLVFKPSMSLYCSLTSLYKNFAILSDFISTSEIEQIKQKYDFSLFAKDFHRKYFSKMCTLKLSSAPPGIPKLSLNNLCKSSDAPCDSNFVNCGSSYNILGTNYEVSLCFEVYFNKKFISKIPSIALQDFVKKLDSFTQCTIQTLLISSTQEYLPLGKIIE